MASVDDLWLVEFGDPAPGEPAHHRPALVVGPPATFGADFPFVILCPVTTRRRQLSLHIEIDPTPTSGLDEISYVQCELVRSVSQRRLVHRLGAIDLTTSRTVRDILHTLIGG
jgi:mRNA interferase MazF